MRRARVVILDKLTYAATSTTWRRCRPRASRSSPGTSPPRGGRRGFNEHRPRRSNLPRSLATWSRSTVRGTSWPPTPWARSASRRRFVAPRRDARSFVPGFYREVYGALETPDRFAKRRPTRPIRPRGLKSGRRSFHTRPTETFGLPTLITNCSNNYGPYQFPEDGSLTI